ncbi:unnamed protein product [Choristocarpus tenellus]
MTTSTPTPSAMVGSICLCITILLGILNSVHGFNALQYRCMNLQGRQSMGCQQGQSRVSWWGACSRRPFQMVAGAYEDITVREAVEWTMGKDSEFSYIDIRSLEERQTLTSPRGSISIPAFEAVEHATGLDKEDEEGDSGDEDRIEGALRMFFEGQEPTNNKIDGVDYEALAWRILPDFVEKMEARFSKDAKLIVGSKTRRSAMACQALVDAGFTEVYNVESQSFIKSGGKAWD